LNPIPIFHPPPSGPLQHRPAGVPCEVIAHAVVQVPAAAIAGLRQSPGSLGGERLPPTVLKHADEQTVVGLVAVLRAIESHGLTATRFTDWGVLAAPRFSGRVALAAAMQRYALEGAWGLSPHLIPHRSLHAISGTVSQVLKIHGPNFGVGGGPNGAAEILLAAAAVLGTRPLPGLWVVLTGWHPEPIPSRDGATATPSVCRAVALALAPAGSTSRSLCLRVVMPETGAPSYTTRETLELENLVQALTAEGGPATVSWPLHGGGAIHLGSTATEMGLSAPHLVRKQGAPGTRSAWTGTGPGSKL
jgi:hypothetical protein